MPPKRGRLFKLDKFNQDPKVSPFINDFQQIMLYKLGLEAYKGKLTKKEVDNIIQTLANRPSNSIQLTGYEKNIILTCKLETELYLILQEICKKLFGSYQSMDQFIHYMIIYFIDTYLGKPKKQLPIKQMLKHDPLEKLRKFEDRFSKYYYTSRQ